MVTLSKFVGQLISDLANARVYADYTAASMSEQYHADPFVKTLPVPHYIIEDAEIEVPVMVVGISMQAEEFAKQKQLLLSVIDEKLPVFLLRAYKFNYVREREETERVKQQKKESENKLKAEANLSGGGEERTAKKKNGFDSYAFSDVLLEAFADSAKTIAEKMREHVTQYIDGYNYEILKLLDMSEDFSKHLTREMKRDIETYSDEEKPYLSGDAVVRSSGYVGNLMFFEFKKIMRSDAGVNVDVSSVQMNEYADKDALMRIKIKVKEQDLNLVVESDAGKEKRYLSLT